MEYDAAVVGSGPNGLAAAITLAQKGLSVIVIEAKDTVGGGTRTSELTLPGFLHDICSAIHPIGAASPFFRSLKLEDYGLQWIYPPVSLAHPLEDGSAVLLENNIEKTVASLGADGRTYTRIMTPILKDWEGTIDDLLRPLSLPRYPVPFINFGKYAFRSTYGLANSLFEGERAKALFAGLGAHSIMPLEARFTASFSMMLGLLGHAVGWPVAKGGSQRIADTMSSYFISLGGHIQTGTYMKSLDDLPKARAILLDITPRQLEAIAGKEIAAKHLKRYRRFKYGPGVFKMDWALDHPIPWKASECLSTASVHLGGTMDEIAEAEDKVSRGKHPENPFVILAQQSLFDQTRAPDGKHTAWGYCHVPNSSTVDMSGYIEAQIERFAPGFHDCIIARHSMSPSDLENYNPNYIGGDIAGGVQDFWQVFARPALRFSDPYAVPLKGIYLCSSSTPPGGGVHGMCGHYAAKSALRTIFGFKNE
ncbi:MAG: NAD(P)/FAD-dependent oxidoreductase [Dehalococcoidia bacterium]|nr:MAG: NAD(P)/FAD-dependent oxidoreductase [Dehalococcoidia bacterium]